MTAGGAMALALCSAAVDDALDPGAPALAAATEVRRALEWLAVDFVPASNRDADRAFGRKKGNRGENFWKHYWLWSLERACSAAGAARLGEIDWYDAGARHLLDTQRDDGSWCGPESEMRATCFALLFFARSTKQSLTPRPGEIVTTPTPPTGERG
jgi:hypothetical protein